MFTKKWVEAVDRRLDDRVYTFTREPRAMSDRPISKNYIYENYGVPAITYEVGDATPRSAITESAQVFAEEMMRLLLEHETGE
jgi:predicted deacylase